NVDGVGAPPPEPVQLLHAAGDPRRLAAGEASRAAEVEHDRPPLAGGALERDGPDDDRPSGQRRERAVRRVRRRRIAIAHTAREPGRRYASGAVAGGDGAARAGAPAGGRPEREWVRPRRDRGGGEESDHHPVYG